MNFKYLLISIFVTTGLVITFANCMKKSSVCVKDSAIASIETTSRSGSVVVLENGEKVTLTGHTIEKGMKVCLLHDVHISFFGKDSIPEKNKKSSYLIK